MKLPEITSGDWLPCGAGTLLHPVTGAPISTEVIEAQGFGRIGEWYDYSNEAPANIQAIRAVPQLLAALNDCLESMSRMPDTDGAFRVTCIQQARAALIAAGATE